jgi:hypothetical protein
MKVELVASHIYAGKIYEPGTHEVEDKTVAEALVKSDKRFRPAAPAKPPEPPMMAYKPTPAPKAPTAAEKADAEAKAKAAAEAAEAKANADAETKAKGEPKK